jgi:hypothetical protein
MSYFWVTVHSTVYLFFIFSLGPLGNIFCRYIFKWSKLTKITGISNLKIEKKAAENQTAGRLIGSFERTLILIGILLRSLEILVAVVALKTVARYKELDSQINAEYFLIGSMASILFAMMVALALIGYDHYLGFDLFLLVTKAFRKEI